MGGVNMRSLSGWWMVLPLLSVASLGAASDDLRLVEAVRMGDREAVRSLLGEHVDVNARQGDGATALAWAAHRDDVATTDLLIRAGGRRERGGRLWCHAAVAGLHEPKRCHGRVAVAGRGEPGQRPMER